MVRGGGRVGGAVRGVCVGHKDVVLDNVPLQEELMRAEWEGRLIFSGEYANKVVHCTVQFSVGSLQ